MFKSPVRTYNQSWAFVRFTLFFLPSKRGGGRMPPAERAPCIHLYIAALCAFDIAPRGVATATTNSALRDCPMCNRSLVCARLVLKNVYDQCLKRLAALENPEQEGFHPLFYCKIDPTLISSRTRAILGAALCG